jgi:phosphatidylglycerophosphate synthase
MDADLEKLLSSHPAEKRAWDSTFPWIQYVARPLSFPISWLWHRSGLGANHATIFTAVQGFASVPLLASGDLRLMAAGAACLVLYTIFDCVDGDLARAWPETGSPAGQFWGELVGNFYLVCYIPLGFSFGEPWTALGALTTACKLLTINIRRNFWETLGRLWEQSKSGSGYEPSTGKWHYKLYYNFTDPQGHVFLLPVFILAGCGREFLALSLAVSLADLAFILTFHLFRAHKVGSKRGQLP